MIYVAKSAVILGDVTLDAESSVWHGTVLRADMDAIRVGKFTNIQDNAVVHVDKGHPVEIEDRVTVGHGAIIHGCTVDSECIIGMNATLGSRCRIGSGSILGAGSVVPEGAEIPPRSIAVGVPARVVRPADEDTAARIEVSWKAYHELAYKTLHARREMRGGARKRTPVGAVRGHERLF